MAGPDEKTRLSGILKDTDFVENWLSCEIETLKPAPLRTVDFDERIDEVLTALSKERDSNVLRFRPRK